MDLRMAASLGLMVCLEVRAREAVETQPRVVLVAADPVRDVMVVAVVAAATPAEMVVLSQVAVAPTMLVSVHP